MIISNVSAHVFVNLYLVSNISSAESDVNLRIGEVWTDIVRLSNIWKSHLPDKINQDLFQDLAVSLLLYGCTT